MRARKKENWQSIFGFRRFNPFPFFSTCILNHSPKTFERTNLGPPPTIMYV